MSSKRSEQDTRTKLQLFIDKWATYDVDPLNESLEWAHFRNFAVETVLLDYQLSPDEIFEACAVDGNRDKGIDAIWLDEGESPATLHIFQSKDTKVSRTDWSKMSDGLLDLFDPYRPQALNRFLREWSASFSDNHPTEFKVMCHIVTSDIKPKAMEKGYSEKRNLLGKERDFDFDVYDIFDLDAVMSTVSRRRETIDIELHLKHDAFFEYSEGPGRKVISALVLASEISDLFERYGKELFRLNPRYFLTLRSPNNAEISKSIKEDPSRFHLLNNGITATGSGIKVNRGPSLTFSDEPPPVPTLRIRDFQIVNGCQTTAVINRVWKGGIEGKDAVNKASVMLRVVEDPTPEYYQAISRATNTQTPLKLSDWRSFERVHDRIRREFDALPEKWFYEFWKGEWDTDYADPRSREPYLMKGTTGSTKEYRKMTSEELAQYGWAFLGAGYGSAERPRRVMEDDETWRRVFPESIHCSQLLLAYLIGRKAGDVLREKAESNKKKSGYYSALKFPIVATTAKILCILHEKEQDRYLDVALSQQLISDIDTWCPNLAVVVAGGLLTYLDSKIEENPTRGYRALVRQSNWVKEAWPQIRSQVNTLSELAPEKFLNGLRSASLNQIPEG